MLNWSTPGNVFRKAKCKAQGRGMRSVALRILVASLHKGWGFYHRLDLRVVNMGPGVGPGKGEVGVVHVGPWVVHIGVAQSGVGVGGIAARVVQCRISIGFRLSHSDCGKSENYEL